MPRLLIVHHTISPALQACFEAVRAGATDDAIEGVEVVTAAALRAGAADALAADGFVLGTPANIGLGDPSGPDLEACWNLGATLAAELSPAF